VLALPQNATEAIEGILSADFLDDRLLDARVSEQQVSFRDRRTGAMSGEAPAPPGEPAEPEEEPIEVPDEPELPEEAPELPEEAPELPEEEPLQPSQHGARQEDPLAVP